MAESESQQKKVVDASKVPVVVERIHVDGLARTANDVVTNRYVKRIFEAKNLQECIFKALGAKEYFDNLGIFKRLTIEIDTSKGKDANPDGVEVTFIAKELNVVGGGIGTTIGSNNEGSINVGLKMPNVMGRAEKLATEFSYGLKKTQNIHATFIKPILKFDNARWQTGLYQTFGEFPWSGYTQTDRGGFVGLDFQTFGGLLRHNLKYEGIWREMACLSRTAAFKVREECGHSLKSAFKHEVAYDTRDSPSFPNRGVLLKWNQEMAGVYLAAADIPHMKNEIEVQLNLPLPLESIFQAAIALGHAMTLDQKSSLPLIDRYFIGGPLTLRGYETRGAGPNADNCFLGGNSFWNAGLHFYTPLPFRPGRGGIGDWFKTHAFANAGNIGDISFRGTESKAEATALFTKPRVSVGFGILMMLGGIARVEVNYCWPIDARDGDRSKKGLQFGIGIQSI